MDNLQPHHLQEHAHQIGEAVACLVQAMGMVANNKEREIEGNAPVYTHKDFNELVEEHSLGYNQLIEKARKF